jgi:hypothetical protein
MWGLCLALPTISRVLDPQPGRFEALPAPSARPVRRPVRVDGLHLTDGVERPTFIQLHINVPERLEATADATGRLADSASDRPNAPVGTSQKRDDAVGLPKLLGPEHNSLVAVERHATFSLQTA